MALYGDLPSTLGAILQQGGSTIGTETALFTVVAATDGARWACVPRGGGDTTVLYSRFVWLRAAALSLLWRHGLAVAQRTLMVESLASTPRSEDQPNGDRSPLGWTAQWSSVPHLHP